MSIRTSVAITIATCAVALITSIAYVASPFYAAWTLREAVRTADTDALRARIVWPSVRASLRQSIALDQNLIDATSLEVDAAPPPRRSLWQSLKRTIGSSILDRFLDTYMTPDGLPKLHAARVKFASTEFDTGTWDERLRAFALRLKRAEFLDLTTIELELEDPRETSRRYVSRLELFGDGAGYTWKLTSLQILRLPSLATPSRVMAGA